MAILPGSPQPRMPSSFQAPAQLVPWETPTPHPISLPADLRGNKRNPGDVIQDGTTQPSHSLGNVPTGRRCSPEEGGGGGRRLGWVFSVWLTSQGMLTLCTLVYRDRDEKKS